MKTAKEHYDQQLTAIYSWMAGGSEAAIERNRLLFRQLEVEKVTRGLAVDLGAGAGFQSVPLAELGFSVVALDFSLQLLAELRERADGLPIRTVQDDLLNFERHTDEQARLRARPSPHFRPHTLFAPHTPFAPTVNLLYLLRFS